MVQKNKGSQNDDYILYIELNWIDTLVVMITFLDGIPVIFPYSFRKIL